MDILTCKKTTFLKNSNYTRHFRIYLSSNKLLSCRTIKSYGCWSNNMSKAPRFNTFQNALQQLFQGFTEWKVWVFGVFQVRISRIWTEYRNLLCKSLYFIEMWENADQEIFWIGHFWSSVLGDVCFDSWSVSQKSSLQRERHVKDISTWGGREFIKSYIGNY